MTEQEIAQAGLAEMVWLESLVDNEVDGEKMLRVFAVLNRLAAPIAAGTHIIVPWTESNLLRDKRDDEIERLRARMAELEWVP